MLFCTLVPQIGAIYLWSYVYNIVRVSSNRSSREVEIIDSPIHKSAREGSHSSSDPLLSTTVLIETEDHEKGLGPLQDGSESKPQVYLCISYKANILFRDKIKYLEA